jgi:SAM-dependent methyltransferase
MERHRSNSIEFERLVAQEFLAGETLHGLAKRYDLSRTLMGLTLDVGAGTGRDAGWLAAHGYDVVAAEPSDAMRAEGQQRHPEPRICCLADRLPGLEQVHRLGLAFAPILLSAVWMHVPPAERPRAFRKLLMLLKPGGALALTLRHGPAAPERAMYPVPLAEIEQLARAHGAFVKYSADAPTGRAEAT